jgi:signal transduction histidine kinase
MERETIRLQSLINDLFTLARAEVGQIELAIKPTDVQAVLARSIDIVASLAWERDRVEVLLEPDGEPLLALVDEGRLEQIVQNLLHNAIRHTPPGGIVALSVVAENGGVLLRVRDTGEGIAPDDLPRIWERFFRASSTHNSEGSGIGLALVKELTESMHGTVEVESILGQGSCFSVWLPAA